MIEERERIRRRPRPVAEVAPGGIGPISNPGINDVLCGSNLGWVSVCRAGSRNAWFRDIVRRRAAASSSRRAHFKEAANPPDAPTPPTGFSKCSVRGCEKQSQGRQYQSMCKAHFNDANPNPNKSSSSSTNNSNSNSREAEEEEESSLAASEIVSSVRRMDPPGHFLRVDFATGHWWDIGCEDAEELTRDGLRHCGKGGHKVAGDEGNAARRETHLFL